MFPLQHSEQVFDASPQACAEVRRFVGAVLHEVIDDDRVYDATLASAEYATNAIKYSDGKFMVAVDVADRHVIVHVVDSGGGATVPTVRPGVTRDTEGGRGLPLVTSLTDATGCVPASWCCAAPSASGWCCWFRINRPAAPSTLFPAPFPALRPLPRPEATP